MNNSLEWTTLNENQARQLVGKIRTGQISLGRAWTELDKLMLQMTKRIKWFENLEKRLKQADGSTYLTSADKEAIFKVSTQLLTILEVIRDAQRELRGVTCRQENAVQLQAPKDDFR